VGGGCERAAFALARPAEELRRGKKNTIRTLATSLHELGQIRRKQGRAECVQAYEEALELSERIGERTGAATCAFNLGHVYIDLPALRDLDQAERWYRRSLELHDEGDGLGRGRCVGELGGVAYERFREARVAGRPKEELLQHLNQAVEFYHEALDLLPADAINDLAVTHNQLGEIYRNAGDFGRAVQHYREAVQRFEEAGDPFKAAQTRFNVAIALLNAGRQADALEYAEAALRGFESFGERAAEEIERARGLIAEIRGS
jgi:tetratricopeptide (TPR) repeat protein